MWPIDKILSCATTTGQSGPGNNGNKGVLSIPQSRDVVSVLAAPADWAITLLHLHSDYCPCERYDPPYPPSKRLNNTTAILLQRLL